MPGQRCLHGAQPALGKGSAKHCLHGAGICGKASEISVVGYALEALLGVHFLTSYEMVLVLLAECPVAFQHVQDLPLLLEHPHPS